MALTGVTAGVAVAGCLLEKGKCEHHVAAALGCFFAKEMSLQDKQERRGKAQVTDSQSSAICAKILIQQ